MAANPRPPGPPVLSPVAELIAAAVQEALDKRLPALAGIGLVPARYVQPKVAEICTGYTEKAQQQKIDNGTWIEGEVWIKAPDGRRLIDLRGYERWCEAGKPGDV